MEPDRADLAEFLRRRREALQPGEVGLEPGHGRRTSGLRREEVADRAHISTLFYTRLEQGRGARPSARTTAALARALRLNPVEREHLFELAGHAAPPQVYRTDRPTPGLLNLLVRIDAPAQIVSDLGATLAQNGLARALVGDQTRFEGLRRSVVFRWFTDPAARAIHPVEEHDAVSRSHVAALRAVQGMPRHDPEADELVATLCRRSAEFAELWNRHEVANRSGSIKTFLHPLVGALVLDCQILATQNAAELLVIFAPVPGSEAAAKIDLLSVVGARSFEADPLPKP